MSAAEMVEVIAARLWQSGCPVDEDDVEAAGINAVLSVATMEQPWIDGWKERGIQEWFRGREQPRLRVALHVPLMDSSWCLDHVGADAAVAAVVRLLRDPARRILVHCSAGAFRSVHICACVLAKTTGRSGVECFRRVDEARGHSPRDGIGLGGWQEHLASIVPEGRS